MSATGTALHPIPRRRVIPGLGLVLAVVVVIVVAVAVGTSAGLGSRRWVLPAGVLATIALTLLAYRRFEVFVLTLLALRTTVDIFHAPAGTTERPASSMAATVVAALFVGASAMWLLARRAGGRRVPLTPTTATIVAFLGACAVSIAGSARPGVSAVEGLRVLSGLLMFPVLERLIAGDSRRAKRVLVACFASALVPLVRATLQYVGNDGHPVQGELSRLTGTFVHPNAFGFYLTLLILMGVGIHRYVGARLRVLLAAALTALGAALVLSYSRGSWVVCVAGLLLIGVLHSRRVLVLLLLLAVALPVAAPSVVTRIADLGEGRTARDTAGNSFAWRIDYWRDTIALAGRNPVTGIGLKMTEYESSTSARLPHNDFLRVLVEAGAAGLTAYVAMLVALARACGRALRRARPTIERGVAVGFSACFLAFVTYSLAGNLFSQVVLLWYFAAFAAVATAMTRPPSAAEGAASAP